MESGENNSLKKANIRSKILSKRNAIDPVRRIELGLAACEVGTEHLKIVPGTKVAGYFPIRSEIDPRPLMDKLREQGAQLSLPVVIDAETIVFRELLRGANLVETGFGTRGPDDSANMVDPDIMIMPLSAFDIKGGRIGYGAGHYDRAISKLVEKGKGPKLFGFAYSIQEVAEVPDEPHDQRLHGIITDAGFFTVGTT